MDIPNLDKMLDAGVHFGHQTLRWNPKMKKFILTERNGIHIINLAKTQENIEKAVEGIQKTLQSGKRILFVGTKKTVRHCVEEEAKRCNMFYVTNRWLGGMLTNFTTVKASIKKIEKIEQMEEKGLIKELKKKEVISLNKKKKKLEAVLGGIREMTTLPGLIIAADTKNEHIAISEARRLGIPIIAIVDSNSNPDEIDFPIPGNDDAIKSVSLIISTLADTVNGIAGAIDKKKDEIKKELENKKKEQEIAAKKESEKSETKSKPDASVQNTSQEPVTASSESVTETVTKKEKGK